MQLGKEAGMLEAMFFFQYPILGSWHCNNRWQRGATLLSVLSVSYPRIVALQRVDAPRLIAVFALSVSYPRIVALQQRARADKLCSLCASFSILSSDRGIATLLAQGKVKHALHFQYPILGSWHCNCNLMPGCARALVLSVSYPRIVALQRHIPSKRLYTSNPFSILSSDRGIATACF